MTETTIELALIAPSLNSSPETAGPGNIEICGDEPPFEKSLEEVMQTNIPADQLVREDIDQPLPPEGQDLPSQGISNVDLDGVLEVRALVEAIYSNEKITREPSVESFVVANNHGGGIAQRASTLPSFSAADIHAKEYLGIDPNGQAQLFRGAVNAAPQDTNAGAPHALSSLESFTASGLRQHSLIENQNSLLLAVQADSKPTIQGNEVQTRQPMTSSKSTEMVSSSELDTHLRVLKSSGGGEARLQLHPAELGRMTVSLTTEGNETRVAFIVENAQAKLAVEASLPRLRDLMDGAGLNLADADVSERDSGGGELQSDDQMTDDRASTSLEDIEPNEQSAPSDVTQLVDTIA